MAVIGNIVVGDESALHLLMHDDASKRIARGKTRTNPLCACAQNSTELKAFNFKHPLFGSLPVKLLVPTRNLRRTTAEIESRLASGDFPAGSFFQLRQGLFATSPELVFLRLATGETVVKSIALGIDLCGRYYLRGASNEIADRTGYLTTPLGLRRYVRSSAALRGVKTARAAVPFVVSNSGSPEETRSWVQFCLPLRFGGFGLDFTHLNYDVRAGRLAKLTSQSFYSVDIANPKKRCGMEYDGKTYHEDASADKRRRNELKALGWDIFPIDASVLYHPDETVRFARQIAKHFEQRLRLSESWEKHFEQLRVGIGLPV